MRTLFCLFVQHRTSHRGWGTSGLVDECTSYHSSPLGRLCNFFTSYISNFIYYRLNLIVTIITIKNFSFKLWSNFILSLINICFFIYSYFINYIIVFGWQELLLYYYLIEILILYFFWTNRRRWWSNSVSTFILILWTSTSLYFNFITSFGLISHIVINERGGKRNFWKLRNNLCNIILY